MAELTQLQLDALTEVINIGVGKAARTLNDILDRHIQLSVPRIMVRRLGEFDPSELVGHAGLEESQEPASVVMPFSGRPAGQVSLIFPRLSAAHLITALTGEENVSPELDPVRIGSLMEIGNIVINSVIGSMSNILHGDVTFSIPEYQSSSIDTIVQQKGSTRDGLIIIAETRFTIELLEIDGFLLLLFEVESIESLLSSILPDQ